MVICCREFVEFLDDYLSRTLPPDQRAAFDAHLAVCPPCVNYIKSYQEAIRLGRAALPDSDEPVPEEIPEDLVRAIVAARDEGR